MIAVTTTSRPLFANPFTKMYAKILLGLLSGFGLLFVLTSPSISNPILDFCFAGIVPGTDYVVDPATILTGLTVLFGSTVVVVLIVSLTRMVRTRRLIQAGPLQTTPVRPIEQPLLAPSAANSLQYGMRQVVMLVGRGTLAVYASGRQIVSVVRPKLAALAAVVYHKSGTYLVWLEPYLERIDNWLELLCRKSVSRVQNWLLRFEIYQVLRSSLVQFKRHLRQLIK